MPRWQVYNVNLSDETGGIPQIKSEEDLVMIHEMAPGSSSSMAARYSRRSASPMSSATSTAGTSSAASGIGMARRKELVLSSPTSSPSRNGSPSDGSTDATAICGWVCAGILGAIASTFLLVIYFLPTQGIFPVMVKLYQRPDKPNIRQGWLQVYPGYNSSIYVHTISLDPSDTAQNVRDIFEVIKSYPVPKVNESIPSPYVHCWFDNPESNQPCFFNREWLGDLCTAEDGYGYNSTLPFVDPCFLIRIENTGNWFPKPLADKDIAESWKHKHDPAFLGLSCRTREGEKSSLTFEQRPVKGFSIHFFPINAFSPDYYLLPAVMIKVRGVPRHTTVNIECWIRTQNKDSLTDSGFVLINFVDRRRSTATPPDVISSSTRSGYNKTSRMVEQPHEVPNTTTEVVSSLSTSPTPTMESTNATATSEATTEDDMFIPQS